MTIVGRDIAPRRGGRFRDRQAIGSGPGPSSFIDFVAADLSDQRQLRDFAAAFRDRRPRLDVLVNNAGGLFGRRRTSADGIEMTFALNHLNYSC